MCGRFALAVEGEAMAQEMAQQFNFVTAVQLMPRYNIAPTQPVAAVRLQGETEQRELTYLRWGLIPSWAKEAKVAANLINARGDTVAEKPAFRSAFKRRRCLIPATGFYEWQAVDGRKQPMYIHLTDSTVFAMAGLWETWQAADGSAIDTCTIITTEPNELMRPIHNRMPVIVEPADYDLWLVPGPKPETARHLLRPFPAERMAAYPVSTLVNSPRHDSPQCLMPLS